MDKEKMRLGLYRKIEIARKQLPKMDEEAFRQRLENSFGVRSRTDLSVHQLSQLVHEFATQDGVQYTAPAKSRNKAVRPNSRQTGLKLLTTWHLPKKNARF